MLLGPPHCKTIMNVARATSLQGNHECCQGHLTVRQSWMLPGPPHYKAIMNAARATWLQGNHECCKGHLIARQSWMLTWPPHCKAIMNAARATSLQVNHECCQVHLTARQSWMLPGPPHCQTIMNVARSTSLQSNHECCQVHLTTMQSWMLAGPLHCKTIMNVNMAIYWNHPQHHSRNLEFSMSPSIHLFLYPILLHTSTHHCFALGLHGPGRFAAGACYSIGWGNTVWFRIIVVVTGYMILTPFGGGRGWVIISSAPLMRRGGEWYNYFWTEQI